MDESGVIYAAQHWPTNAHMIVDVARLGYIKGLTLDVTFGEGVFWRKWRPRNLITVDKFTPAMVKADFTALPFRAGQFQTVIDDPPYKFNGTPSPFEKRYGVHLPTRWQDRLALIRKSVHASAYMVAAGGHLLVKCMDQVVSGKVVWQTDIVTQCAKDMGMTKVDRLDYLTTPRVQPHARQIHARRNYSTLLIFQK